MKVNEQTYQFIREHIEENPTKLRLKYSGKQLPDIDISLAITQIEARQKAAAKLRGVLDKYEKFLFPDTLSAEQCTAALIAELHAKIAGENSDVLDLTCGLGIDTLALAQGAKSLTTCDIDATHIDYITHNADVLDRQNITARCCESGEFLSSLPADKHYSLIFADPARRSYHNKRTYALEDCSPDILQLMPLIRAHADRLLIKVSPMLDVDMLLRQLPDVQSIYAVSLKGECKELLVDCLFTENEITRRYFAIDILRDGEVYEYSFNEVQDICPPPYINNVDDVTAGKYLFEPNASLMKLLHKAPLGKSFPTLRKLGANTHLYVSDEKLPECMPGRVLRIEKVLLPSKKMSKELPRQANIVTRNYPESADKLKTKLKINDGGTHFIYACSLLDKKGRLLLCTPMSQG